MNRQTMDRFLRAECTYALCGICGSEPKTDMDEPNRSPLRYWDADDGWRIGSLCRPCAEDALEARPQADDFAYVDCRDDPCTGEPDTDLDPITALE